MTSNLRVQELDFDAIKDNLKEFMRGRPEFTDYDFEGSGLNALLNVLAYNTHYNAVLANMQMNELFLDTATKRTTAAIHASRLGYIPKSMRSPTAIVDLEIFPEDNPPNLTIGKGAAFSASIAGATYQFVTTEARTIPRSTSGRYVFTNLELKEGSYRVFRYKNTAMSLNRFVIPSRNVDIRTLSVKVQVSESNTRTNIYSLNTSIVDNNKDALIYYLKLNQAGYYEVSFGDDVISNAIDDGNIVILDYLETNGPDSNGAANFTFVDAINGYTSNYVTTVTAAFGGDIEETADQIKTSAQNAIGAQNRAVTASDYIHAIKEIYPAESIAVWGGENHEPPTYGKVFIALKPTGGGTTTAATKEYIGREIVRKKNVVTVTPVFIDPIYTYVEVNTVVYYDDKLTYHTDGSIQALVAATISQFSDDNLGRFNNTLRYSKLCNAIDNTEPAIFSNITKITLRKEVNANIITESGVTISYGNPIVAGSVLSAGFTTQLVDSPTFYEDDGNGTIRLFYFDGVTKKILKDNAGFVDYQKGSVTLNKINIIGVTNADLLAVRAVPASNDVFSARENIIMLNDADITVRSIVDTNNVANHIFTASR